MPAGPQDPAHRPVAEPLHPVGARRGPHQRAQLDERDVLRADGAYEAPGPAALSITGGTSKPDSSRSRLRRAAVVQAPSVPLDEAPDRQQAHATATAGQLSATAATAVQVSQGRHLLVADPAAQRLYTYRVSDMARTGQLQGVELAAHAGTVVLPDGHRRRGWLRRAARLAGGSAL